MAVRARPRTTERGAALFLVMMVVTLVTAIGVFAVRTTSLVNVSAGFNRQAVQTGYIAEFAANAVTSDMFGLERHYFGRIASGVDDCESSEPLESAGTNVPTPIACEVVASPELYDRVKQDTSLAGSPLPGTSTLSTDLFGTLGTGLNGGLAGAFKVELTDPGTAPARVAGTDVGGTSGTPMQYKQVTLTAFANVRPATGDEPTTCDPGASAVLGIRTVRAHMTLGPIPGG